MKKAKTSKDSRIQFPHFGWKQFFATFSILIVLSAGQSLVLSAYLPYDEVPVDFALGMAGYWAIVAAVFSFVTHGQIRKKFDKPMQKFGKAAKQVADGDFSVYLEPIHTADKFDYMDAMFMDFNKMVEELGSIETLKNDFISNVSHEIKTPLSIIQNYATVLQKDDLSPEERKEYAHTIINAAQNLTTLVTNILKLNKLENQEISPAAEAYDLCRQLCDCALTFESIWDKKDITFHADMDDRVMIYADEGMMEIVWHNLLSNAFKFTEPGGTVTLTQTSDKEWVTVSVADSGCGMSEDTMKRIFDKFYQGDTSHSSEGNGLGLALTQRVLELAGGSISVRSQPGKGSVFTVRLPIHAKQFEF